MSIEQRRAKIIKKKKISKVIKAVRNKHAAEFKRKDDIYKIVLPLIISGGKNGATSTSLRETLQTEHSIILNHEQLNLVLFEHIRKGQIKKKTDNLDNIVFVFTGKPPKK